jgi:UMF1 family MFS transporter
MNGRIIMGKYNKIEKSWILYDCTISTYSMIVISTILPIFFRMVFENAGGNSSMCTVYWGYINSISRLLIAVAAPIIGTMVVAFPCSIIFGKLSEKFKGKTMLYVGIIIYSVICVYANFIHNMVGFLILSILVGTSQGGMQAISRSYFGKIIPKERNNEFFGFFNIFGRFAAILGPSMIAVASQITGKSSMGIFSLLILFVFGGLFLTRVSSVEDESVKADLEKDVVV